MKVRFAGVLVRFVNYQKAVSVDAPSVRAGLDQLMNDYPKLRRVLLTADGQVRATHKIFVNGEELSSSELDRKVKGDDEVEVMTAIAGG